MAYRADNQHSSGPAVYQITVRGIIEANWSNWFDGLTIAPQANGETLLSGPIVDQSALFGLLNKIHDLGLPLTSVRRIHMKDTDEKDE